MKNQIKLVIFDLDGTLVSLPVDYDRLKLEIGKILGTNDISPISEKLSKIDEALRRKVFEIWTKFEMEALPNLKLIEEGIKLYHKYQNKTRCLVTLQGRRVTKAILKKVSLSFDFIVTREDSLFRSEQIKIITHKLKVDPRNVLMIGDRESDKIAAEKVGCKFIYVK